MTASSGEASVVSLPVVVMELAAAEPSATPVSWNNPVSSAVSPSSSWQPVTTPPNTTKASTIMTTILPVLVRTVPATLLLAASSLIIASRFAASLPLLLRRWRKPSGARSGPRITFSRRPPHTPRSPESPVRGTRNPTDAQDQVAHSHVPAVSYTHLRAHETDSYLVCRL